MNIKLIIILLLLISTFASAQLEFAEDYSFKQDKKLHTIYGAGISGGVFLLIHNKTNDVNLAFNAAWMSASFAGLSKEGYDIIRGQEASIADFGYTTISGVFIAGIMWGVTKHRNKKRAKRNKKLRLALNIE